MAASITHRFDWGGIDTYVEPFVGGGSVYLHLLPRLRSLGVRSVVLNDLDRGLMELWLAVLGNSHDEFVERVRSVKPSVDLWVDACDRLRSGGSDPLDKLVVHQMSFSGLGTRAGSPIGGFEQRGEYGVGCRWNPDGLAKKWRAIRSHAEGIDHRLVSVSALSLIGHRGLIYLDPPYYVHGDALYETRFRFHNEMAAQLSLTGGRWYLSYDDVPEVRSLYRHHVINEVSASYTMNSGKGKKPKHELLIESSQVSISSAQL